MAFVMQNGRLVGGPAGRRLYLAFAGSEFRAAASLQPSGSDLAWQAGEAMISVPIKNVSGQEVGSYQFDPADLAPGINKQLLHDVVVMYQANRRQGTVKTKGRSEVAGSTIKIYRQKGTGRARMGPKRQPIRRGGGHAHAKVPVDHSYRLPKKAIKLATRMALLSKFLDGQVTVIDQLSLSDPKTKVVAGALKSLGLAGKSCLLTIEQHDPVVWRCARNIAGVCVSPASDLNAYDLLRQRNLLVTKGALDKLRARTGKAGD
jgi:large subunit ribosomal protein L4